MLTMPNAVADPYGSERVPAGKNLAGDEHADEDELPEALEVAVDDADELTDESGSTVGQDPTGDGQADPAAEDAEDSSDKSSRAWPHCGSGRRGIKLVSGCCQDRHMRCAGQFSSNIVVLLAAIAVAAGQPTARADSRWVAVASSPSHEALDWKIDASRQAAETGALQQCAVLQRADDCRILASGPNCVAVVWDASQPLNRPHAVAADTSAAALSATVAIAGPFANDPSVRCSYMSYGPAPDNPPLISQRQLA